MCRLKDPKSPERLKMMADKVMFEASDILKLADAFAPATQKA